MRFLVAIIGFLSLSTSALPSKTDGNHAKLTGLLDRYIIKLRDDVSKDQSMGIMIDLLSPDSRVTRATWLEFLFNGFAALLDPESRERLLQHPLVEYVQRDVVIPRPKSAAAPIRIPSIAWSREQTLDRRYHSTTTQNNAPWGLSRLSANTPLQGNPQAFAFNYTYSVKDDSAGHVHCFVVDSGIYAEHPDFTGRASRWASFTGDDNDDRGSGSHLAGVIGGQLMGVAKNVNIHAVKVFASGFETLSSDLIDAINAIMNAATYDTNLWPLLVYINWEYTPGEGQDSIRDAITKLLNPPGLVGHAGTILEGSVPVKIPVVLPGGDGAAGAAVRAIPGVITVGATNINDRLDPSMNVGPVDMLAPGVDILGPSHQDAGSATYRSGTDTAAAHVAGLVAYMMEIDYAHNRDFKVQETVNKLYDKTLKNVVGDVPTFSLNRLARNDVHP